MARWIKSLHVNHGKSIAQTITDLTDYAENPDKTRKGELGTGYQCSPLTADTEFILAKQQYTAITAHKATKAFFDEHKLEKPPQLRPYKRNILPFQPKRKRST